MKRVSASGWLLLIAGVLGVCGCETAQKFEDVSSAPAYRAYVGARYELTVAMHLSGVNAPPGYEKTVDYYVVGPASPSWSGPELITRDTLPPGTVLEVDAVRRCTNCLFGQVVEANVRIHDYRTQFHRPVHISLEYLRAEFVRPLGG